MDGQCNIITKRCQYEPYEETQPFVFVGLTNNISWQYGGTTIGLDEKREKCDFTFTLYTYIHKEAIE